MSGRGEDVRGVKVKVMDGPHQLRVLAQDQGDQGRESSKAELHCICLMVVVE